MIGDRAWHIRKMAVEHRLNAIEFNRIVDRAKLQIKRVNRELLAGRLALAVSELLFVEMYRTDACKLKLSRVASMRRLAWLEGPVKKITGAVIRAVNDVAIEKTPKKILDSFL